jgi:hypothetical protein
MFTLSQPRLKYVWVYRTRLFGTNESNGFSKREEAGNFSLLSTSAKYPDQAEKLVKIELYRLMTSGGFMALRFANNPKCYKHERIYTTEVLCEEAVVFFHYA